MRRARRRYVRARRAASEYLPVAISTAACFLCVIIPRLSSADESLSSWATKLTLEEAYTDNLRSAGAGGNIDDAYFTTLSARIGKSRRRTDSWPDEFKLGVRWRVYPEFSERDFVEFRPEIAYRIGNTRTFLRLRYVPHKVGLEEDDGDDGILSERSVTAGLERKFGYRKAWRARGQFEGDWDEFDSPFDERDSYTSALSLDLRYRMNRVFIPRARVKAATRSGRDNNLDRDEYALLAGFDVHLWRESVFRFRYKYSSRDYSVSDKVDADGRNSNFQRDDDIDQFVLALDVPLSCVEGLALHARYKRREGDSTKTSRIFNVDEGGVSISYSVQ